MNVYAQLRGSCQFVVSDGSKKSKFLFFPTVGWAAHFVGGAEEISIPTAVPDASVRVSTRLSMTPTRIGLGCFLSLPNSQLWGPGAEEVGKCPSNQQTHRSRERNSTAPPQFSRNCASIPGGGC